MDREHRHVGMDSVHARARGPLRTAKAIIDAVLGLSIAAAVLILGLALLAAFSSALDRAVFYPLGSILGSAARLSPGVHVGIILSLLALVWIRVGTEAMRKGAARTLAYFAMLLPAALVIWWLAHFKP